MPTSIIKVYNSSRGKWESRAKVVLSFMGGLNAGQTPPVYTDSNGKAVIDHSSTGKATIYVNGSNAGKMNAPDSVTVEI